MAWSATAIGQLDNLIREELPAVLHESLPAIAPIYDKIEKSSMDVIRDTGIGRGWKVTHNYATGIAGLIESGDPLGPGMAEMIGASATYDPQVQMLAGGASSGRSNLSIFPTAEQSPHTSDLRRDLVLHKVVGNFSLPVTWMQSDALTATQVKKIGRDIQAVGKLKAIVEASSFFSHNVTNSSGSQTQVLGRISAIAENSTIADFIDITIDEQYGRICNFRQGMSIDIVADSSGTLQNGTATDGTDVRNYTHTTAKYARLIIVNIDFISKIVTLRPINTDTGALCNYGSGTSGDIFQAGQAGAADDWLTLANTSRAERPQCSWGLNDWIKGSGKIMGGSTGAAALDLDYYTQFKSLVKAVNSPLTDNVLNRYIAGYLDAYPGMTLDTIITTQGVNQKWLEQPLLGNARHLYDRTGKSLKMKGGWSEVTYEWGGRTFNYVVSPMCLSKTLYALKFGEGNVKRYQPPTVGGSDSRVDGVEFLAPLGGHNGIFKIAHASTGASQDLVEAPFWMYKLVAPIDPKAVKLTGLTEATMV
jgi:hypothetical protein